MMLRSVAYLIFLWPSPSVAHEAACHVCTGDVDASVRTSACQLLVLAGNALTDGTSDECRGIQYQGVTEGCCDTPTNFCNLCEQGGNLPNPEQLASTLTCAEVGGFGSFSSNDGAECVDYQATYGVYCGCNNPIALEAAECNICENRGPIMYRKLVPATQFQGANGPANRYCGLLEYYAQFSTVLDSCEDYQDAFADDCCRPMTESPIVSPTDQPIVSPTNAPIIAPADAPATLATDSPVVSTTAAPVTGQPVVAEVTSDPTASPMETVTVGDRSVASSHSPVIEAFAIVGLWLMQW